MTQYFSTKSFENASVGFKNFNNEKSLIGTIMSKEGNAVVHYFKDVLKSGKSTDLKLEGKTDYFFRLTEISIPAEFKLVEYTIKNGKVDLLGTYDSEFSVDLTKNYLAYCFKPEKKIVKSSLESMKDFKRKSVFKGQNLSVAELGIASRDCKHLLMGGIEKNYLPVFSFREHFFIPTIEGNVRGLSFFATENEIIVEDWIQKSISTDKYYGVGVSSDIISDNVLGINFYKKAELIETTAKLCGDD